MFQRINTTNDDGMNEFDAYTKVVEYYERGTPIHPVVVKYKLIKMVVQYTDNSTTADKEKE